MYPSMDRWIDGSIDRWILYLAASWALLRPLWGPLGVSWGPLGGPVGPSWAPLGVLVGLLGSSWGPSWSPRGPNLVPEGSQERVLAIGVIFWVGFGEPAGGLSQVYFGLFSEVFFEGLSGRMLANSGGVLDPSVAVKTARNVER